MKFGEGDVLPYAVAVEIVAIVILFSMPSRPGYACFWAMLNGRDHVRSSWIMMDHEYSDRSSSTRRNSHDRHGRAWPINICSASARFQSFRARPEAELVSLQEKCVSFPIILQALVSISVFCLDYRSGWLFVSCQNIAVVMWVGS